ncbi:MAG: hypothetical protein M3032_12905 [Verrucomicrobiota bacterium]|nr:hypothetical protein [Verrucomicrobiota bacterium]
MHLPTRTALALLGLVSLGFATALPVRADIAELTLMSQPGDFIGQGQTKDIIYTPANSSSFSASVVTLVNGMPAFARFVMGTVTGSNATNTFALLDFATNQLGIALQTGSYGSPGNTAQRASFAQPGHAGLDVSFQNRGSNTLTGNFTVNYAKFFQDMSNNWQVGAFDVTFEQHSEGATPALFGHFTFTRTGFAIPTVPETGSGVLLLLSSLVGLITARTYLTKRERRSSAPR